MPLHAFDANPSFFLHQPLYSNPRTSLLTSSLRDLQEVFADYLRIHKEKLYPDYMKRHPLRPPSTTFNLKLFYAAISLHSTNASLISNFAVITLSSPHLRPTSHTVELHCASQGSRLPTTRSVSDQVPLKMRHLCLRHLPHHTRHSHGTTVVTVMDNFRTRSALSFTLPQFTDIECRGVRAAALRARRGSSDLKGCTQDARTLNPHHSYILT